MFKQLKLGAKLTGGFLAVVALTLVLAASSLVGIGRVRTEANEVTHNLFPSMHALGLLSTGIGDVRRIELGLLIAARAGNTQMTSRLQEDLARLVKSEIDVGRATYEALPRRTEEEALWRDFDGRLRTFQQRVDGTLAAIAAGQLERADTLVQQDLAYFNEAKTLAEKLVDLNDRYATEIGAQLTGTAERARTETVVVATLVTLLGIGLGLFLTRAIVRPVRLVAERTERLRTACLTDLEAGLGALARGDASRDIVPSTQPLALDRGDEIGDLARTLDRMIAQTQSAVQGYTGLQRIVGSLVAETQALVGQAKSGKLSARGDAAKFEGSYAQLVGGINDTLDAIVAPVTATAAALERLAERDLTARVTGAYQGDHARIKDALNRAAESIETTLAEVAAASQQVASAAGQISAGSQALASGASEQASALEEVSSSLHEMTSMAAQSAGNAKEARALADGSREATVKGVESMRGLSEAMAGIKQSASATAKIVKTIDEIAFQTNLLALNAAVEAARAGDAGRGFAVVAEEVRALAQRSAEAAKQTAALIDEAVRNSERGVVITDEVVQHLDQIDGRSGKVTEVMAEVAAASEQQTTGVAQVNAAVEQVNLVTQQVASNSEEAAAAAEELTSQAMHLREMVGTFRLSARRDAGAVERPAARGARPASAPASVASVAAKPAARPAAKPAAKQAAKPAAKPAATTAATLAAGPTPRATPTPSARLAAVDPESFLPFHDDGDDETLQEF